MPQKVMPDQVENQELLLVTSGPGATNAVTALTDAYMDSVPLFVSQVKFQLI